MYRAGFPHFVTFKLFVDDGIYFSGCASPETLLKISDHNNCICFNAWDQKHPVTYPSTVKREILSLPCENDSWALTQTMPRLASIMNLSVHAESPAPGIPSR